MSARWSVCSPWMASGERKRGVPEMVDGEGGEFSERAVWVCRGLLACHVAAEIGGEFADGLVAVLAVVRGGLGDDRLQVGIDLDAVLVAGLRDASLADERDDFGAGARHVGFAECDDLEEDEAERVDVGALVGVFAVDGLRREETRRAGDGVRLHPGGRVVAGLHDLMGDAPVHDVGLAEFADEDVFRLEVAVHDVAAVGVIQGVADAEDDLQAVHQGFAFVELSDAGGGVFVVELFEVAFQRLAVGELHHEVESVIGVGVQRVDRDDGRMAELGGDAGFLDELAAGELVVGLRLQGLDGHEAAEVDVDPLADDPLTALGEDFARHVFGVEVFQLHVEFVVEADLGSVHVREGDRGVLSAVKVLQSDRDRGHGIDFSRCGAAAHFRSPFFSGAMARRKSRRLIISTYQPPMAGTNAQQKT